MALPAGDAGTSGDTRLPNASPDERPSDTGAETAVLAGPITVVVNDLDVPRGADRSGELTIVPLGKPSVAVPATPRMPGVRMSGFAPTALTVRVTVEVACGGLAIDGVVTLIAVGGTGAGT